jgi:hypothetical protein
LRIFAVVLDEPNPRPPIAVFFETGQEEQVSVERIERLLRERL